MDWSNLPALLGQSLINRYSGMSAVEDVCFDFWQVRQHLPHKAVSISYQLFITSRIRASLFN